MLRSPGESGRVKLRQHWLVHDLDFDIESGWPTRIRKHGPGARVGDVLPFDHRLGIARKLENSSTSGGCRRPDARRLGALLENGLSSVITLPISGECVRPKADRGQRILDFCAIARQSAMPRSLRGNEFRDVVSVMM